ncbi:MAG: type II toxin-antitoxin system antitoxin MazE7 [Solirubrobacteraceae bacterium]
MLAAQARAQGVSLSSMLNDIARRADRDAIFAAERAASSADASQARVRAEEREWEATLRDGVD